MKARIIQSTHDAILFFGSIAILLNVLIMSLTLCGHIKGIIGWTESKDTFAFNVEGKDYIQK